MIIDIHTLSLADGVYERSGEKVCMFMVLKKGGKLC